jgi:hypothetical protein
MIKDGCLVLRAPGGLTGMMAVPEDLQQFLVGDNGRIEIDLDGLSVIAEAVVGGV